MLSHHYHGTLPRQIGVCWRRTADDVVWTPLPLFHFNAIVTAVLGPLVYGGRAAIESRFSVSRFWPEMNRTGATITSTLGTMAYLLAHDADRAEMPRSGAPAANTSLRLIGAAPLAGRGRLDPPGAVRRRHLQRRLRHHRGEPDLVAAAGRREQAERRRRRQRRVLRRAHLRRRRRRAAPRRRRRDRHPAQAAAHHVRGLLGPAARRRSPPAATGGTTPATSAGSTTTATSSSSTARPTTCAGAARTSPASRSSAS